VIFAAVTLCVTSQRVFVVVSVYFVIDSVRKLLDSSSYYFDMGPFVARHTSSMTELRNTYKIFSWKT
jgi:hypothetical protein